MRTRTDNSVGVTATVWVAGLSDVKINTFTAKVNWQVKKSSTLGTWLTQKFDHSNWQSWLWESFQCMYEKAVVIAVRILPEYLPLSADTENNSMNSWNFILWHPKFPCYGVSFLGSEWHVTIPLCWSRPSHKYTNINILTTDLRHINDRHSGTTRNLSSAQVASQSDWISISCPLFKSRVRQSPLAQPPRLVLDVGQTRAFIVRPASSHTLRLSPTPLLLHSSTPPVTRGICCHGKHSHLVRHTQIKKVKRWEGTS